ncbi:hypothetical protein [Massilia cavernae]|uniref:hypothetical protein n=1 Tax=Massilia cavernae TaxID=2320864 RepID=UPI001600A66B|nr:hypothetical protein [Massilia cavernae]
MPGIFSAMLAALKLPPELKNAVSNNRPCPAGKRRLDGAAMFRAKYEARFVGDQ